MSNPTGNFLYAFPGRYYDEFPRTLDPSALRPKVTITMSVKYVARMLITSTGSLGQWSNPILAIVVCDRRGCPYIACGDVEWRRIGRLGPQGNIIWEPRKHSRSGRIAV